MIFLYIIPGMVIGIFLLGDESLIIGGLLGFSIARVFSLRTEPFLLAFTLLFICASVLLPTR